MTTSIYEMYATDHQREVEGFWHPVSEKISFKLARAGGANMTYTQVLEAKTRPHRREVDSLNTDTDKKVRQSTLDLLNRLMRESFAEAVIQDWKGVTDEKGKKLVFSPAAATKLLTDLPDLFIELREVAAKQANFRHEDIKDDVGN